MSYNVDSNAGEKADSGFVDSDERSTLKKTTSLKRKDTPADSKQSDEVVTSSSSQSKQLRTVPSVIQKKPAKSYSLTKSRRELKYQTESKKWIEPDEDGDTDLHIVLSQETSPKNTSIAELIIDNVAHPQALDMRNNFGLTPISIAASRGHGLLIIRLRVAGANPNIIDGYGHTPLHHAVSNNREDSIKALVVPLFEEDINTYCSNPKQHQRYRTNLNAKNCDGKTPLFLAAERRNTRVLRLLLMIGADPNITENCAGRTALHNAVELADLTCIEELLKFNTTNVNALTYAGRTPLDVAQQLTCDMGPKIISKLKDHGAQPGVDYDDDK